MNNTEEMTADEMREAMIEITLGKKPSKLKKTYPAEYAKLQREIRAMIKAGKMVEIPGDFV
jgi:hypothetical protein